MDRIDRKILRKLVEQGRSTQFELAEAAALSPSAAARRQKALEESGLIAGYRADLNLRELGYTATVMKHCLPLKKRPLLARQSFGATSCRGVRIIF